MPRPHTSTPRRRGASSGAALERGELRLTWDRFPGHPSLRVTATVTGRPDTSTARRIALEGIDALAVEQVRFARMTGIGRLGAREELAVPRWMGQRTHEPRRPSATAPPSRTRSRRRLALASGRFYDWPLRGASNR